MSKRTLVFGASLNPERYSNIAINRLKDFKHEVNAFGLKSGTVRDVHVDTTLINYEDIDTVTLYINPSQQVDYYDYIIGLKPNRVIFNPGTENPEFYDLLKKNAINFEVACTLVLLSIGQY